MEYYAEFIFFGLGKFSHYQRITNFPNDVYIPVQKHAIAYDFVEECEFPSHAEKIQCLVFSFTGTKTPDMFEQNDIGEYVPTRFNCIYEFKEIKEK
jgi:hypothetical protein